MNHLFHFPMARDKVLDKCAQILVLIFTRYVTLLKATLLLNISINYNKLLRDLGTKYLTEQNHE